MEEGPKFEGEKAKDWQHKQYLDSLPTFEGKLEYWVQEVCKDKYTKGRSYSTAIPYTGVISPEMLYPSGPIIKDLFGTPPFCIENEFTLEPPKPGTNDERAKMNEAFMNLIRRDLADVNLKKQWDEYIDNWEQRGRKPFEEPFGIRPVISVHNRIQNFWAQFEKAPIKTGFSERMREVISEEIEGLGAYFAPYIKAVRRDFGGEKKIDWGRLKLDFHLNKAMQGMVKELPLDEILYGLARVWDLIEFEMFLLKGPKLAEEGHPSHVQVAPSQPRTREETAQIVRRILSPLGGLSPQKTQIMTTDDYNRLIEYTDILVSTEELPDNIRQIPRTGISNEHIRYTFYRLHRVLFGKRKRKNFVPFLHEVFSQFKGTQTSTTDSKFSTPPKTYKKDFEGYIGEVE